MTWIITSMLCCCAASVSVVKAAASPAMTLTRLATSLSPLSSVLLAIQLCPKFLQVVGSLDLEPARLGFLAQLLDAHRRHVRLGFEFRRELPDEIFFRIHH